MEKLSEAGKLYLQDFYILNEAQSDVFIFLDAVMNQVYQNLVEGIKDLSGRDDVFVWEAWKNESKPGRLDVWPSTKKEVIPFRKGKGDLYLICRDVRHEAELSDTASVSVTIRCTNYFLRSLRQVPSETLELALKTAEEHGTGVDVNKRNMLYREEVKLNLDSVSDSVDSVTEFIMERCQGVREFALRIMK
ncbi:MAG: hypothetical protein AVO34_11400 [Firmicutes bacterium ML8_F2]|jgi:hypothetical protein|nr:MAG: hypothetical protein AVO34_11400 [Firmicutes bacterium ML8_F2]